MDSRVTEELVESGPQRTCTCMPRTGTPDLRKQSWAFLFFQMANPAAL